MRRIDEILALPYSADDFKGQEVPPSDDDSWLYNGEDELNSALSERTKELELYNAKHKNKQKSKAHQDAGESSSMNVDDFDPSEIAKTMKAFVSKVSSYEGAEVPKDRFVFHPIHSIFFGHIFLQNTNIRVLVFGFGRALSPLSTASIIFITRVAVACCSFLSSLQTSILFIFLGLKR